MASVTEKAVLSGQYQYISIRSHGTEAGCGNYGAGLRAAFAYIISYLFVENASIISDPEEAIYYVKFSNLVDNKYLQLCDSKTPEKIAEAVKAEYKRQLFGTGAGNGYAGLLPDISDLSGKEGVVFDNKTDIVRVFGKKLRTPDKKELYTEDGDPRTTEAEEL